MLFNRICRWNDKNGVIESLKIGNNNWEMKKLLDIGLFDLKNGGEKLKNTRIEYYTIIKMTMVGLMWSNIDRIRLLV